MKASPFTLQPHTRPGPAFVRALSGNVSRTPAGLMVTYVLEADLARMRVPQGCAPRFADELWRHTCFEFFVARKGDTAYHEFNFSPASEWATYAFSRYREPAVLAADLMAIKPHVTVCRAPDRLELDAIVRLEQLSLRYQNAPLSLGLSAVIEAEDGVLSYWALTHPASKPDFHHPDAFVLELDEIRN